MTNVAYPSVYAALLTVTAAALPNLRVVDGYDVSTDPSDAIWLGVPSLSDQNNISAGQFTQDQNGMGATGVVLETGAINGIAWSWNGSADNDGAAAARLAAAGYAASLGAAIRANRTLGVTAFDLVAQMATGSVSEDKTNGATCAVSFTVTYKALI